MNLINTVTLDYPRSLWQLRQENPNVSFPANPTDDDLAAFDHAIVHPTPQPTDYDQRLQRTEEGTPEAVSTSVELADPENSDGETEDPVFITTWQQRWTVRDASEQEIAEYDAANAPAPQWVEFGVALALNPLVTDLYAQIPAPVGQALSIGLKSAGDGDSALFLRIWSTIKSTGAISTDLLQQIATLAAEHHLPAAFIQELG